MKLPDTPPPPVHHHLVTEFAAVLADMHRQVDWDGHLSAEGEKRVLPSLRVIISQFQGQPGIIGLHGGLPAGSAFPITSLSFTLRDGTTATIDDPTQVRCLERPVTT
jgi:phage I-like protein